MTFNEVFNQFGRPVTGVNSEGIYYDSFQLFIRGRNRINDHFVSRIGHSFKAVHFINGKIFL